MTRPATIETAELGLDEADLSLMLTIRAFELKLLDLYGKGLLNGTTHTCLGQEYIPVAMEALLDPRDRVFSNHRGHGHYLARFRDPAGLLAEIMGREGAVCNGVGGSQHIHRDGFLSTGVQGESLPVASGSRCTSNGPIPAGSPASTSATARSARARSTRRSTSRRCGGCRCSSWSRTTASPSPRPPRGISRGASPAGRRPSASAIA